MTAPDAAALVARVADLERRLLLAEARIGAYDTAWAALAPSGPAGPPRPPLRLIQGGTP